MNAPAKRLDSSEEKLVMGEDLTEAYSSPTALAGRQSPPIHSTRGTLIRYSLMGALVFSAALMNVYFAWTSHVLWDDQALRATIANMARDQMRFIGLGSWYIGSKSFGVREFIDLEVVLLALATALFSFLVFRHRGRLKATLRMLEIGALSVMPLGIEIYLLDTREFYIHASIAQVETGFMPWFTNEDLLFLALAVFFVSAFIDWRIRPRPALSGLPDSSR
jgi:hypothetical protein